jgi:hypothetical protein
VIDFGLARVDSTLSMATGSTVGTPAFMAPEQARGDPGSSSSDIFAWGAVIAYAGTGHLPFHGASVPSVLYRVVHDEPDVAGLDDRLRTLVTWAMAKEPGDRPSARELLTELLGREVSGERAIQVAEITWTARDEPERRPMRRRAIVAALAVLCAAVVAGTIIGVVRSKPSVAIFDDDFDTDRGWPRSATATSVTAYAHGGYHVDVGAGRELVPTAPTGHTRLGNVTVRATARIERGDGAWGIWCNGNPAQESRGRYDFFLTALGEVAILKRSPTGRPVHLLPYTRTPGVNPHAANRLEAECTTMASAAGNAVSLRLFINGRPAASVVDHTAPYGAGAVGVSAYAGRLPTSAAFDSFTVRRLRT